MADWSIRQAVPADAGALAACIDAAYARYVADGIDLPAVSDGLAEDIRDNSVWVAVRGGTVVGGLVLVLRPDHAVLANVAVDPVAAGAGIGRALVDRAEQEARRRGLGHLRLTTHVAIPQNVLFYERLGWRETGRDGKKVRMEKPIAG